VKKLSGKSTGPAKQPTKKKCEGIGALREGRHPLKMGDRGRKKKVTNLGSNGQSVNTMRKGNSLYAWTQGEKQNPPKKTKTKCWVSSKTRGNKKGGIFGDEKNSFSRSGLIKKNE